MTPSQDRFDRWLERELHKDLDQVTQRPAPRRPRYAGGRAGARRLVTLFSGFSGAGAAVASKAALGFAVTAFAVGITGAAVETAVTGSPVPAPLEQQVATAVESLSAPAVGQPAAPPEPTSGIRVIAPARSESGLPKPPPPAAGGDRRNVIAAAPTATPGRHQDGGSTSHPAAEPSERPEPEPTPKASPKPSPKASPSPSVSPRPSPTPRPEHTGERGGHGQVEAHTVRPRPSPDQEQDG